MNITLDNFGLEWDHGDGAKHKADCDDLIKAYEQSQWLFITDGMSRHILGAGLWICSAPRWIMRNIQK